MGQKLSSQPTVPLIWILRGQPKMHPNPEQPIKFQYKRRRKIATNQSHKCDQHDGKDEDKVTEQLEKSEKTQHVNKNIYQRSATRHKSIKHADKDDAAGFNLFAFATGVDAERLDKFGYDIEDIDQFLAKASIEKPANIPVVLSVPTVLYQTRAGGYQAELALPLGMVVNAVFRNQHWLYAQTPHGEEGYIAYAACIPLGIIPAADDAASPCWETSTDVFPRPSGNQTDTEKMSSTRSECSLSRRSRRRLRHTVSRGRGSASACGERSVDRLYLRASSAAAILDTRLVRRHTLLVVDEDYAQEQEGQANTMRVRKGDVVTLLSAQLRGWFWVRDNDGAEGYIPAAVAGYGYL